MSVEGGLALWPDRLSRGFKWWLVSMIGAGGEGCGPVDRGWKRCVGVLLCRGLLNEMIQMGSGLLRSILGIFSVCDYGTSAFERVFGQL